MAYKTDTGKTISFYIENELLEVLDNMCDTENRSRSNMLNNLIRKESVNIKEQTEEE